MKGLIRCAIAGSFTVAALAVVYIQLLLTPARTTFEGIIFVSREPVDLKSVFVQNESGAFRFYYDYEDGGYVVDDIPPHIVDFDVFVGFMSNSARIAALRRIPSRDEELHGFGLNPPSATVEIEFLDGEVLKLNIGGIERVSGHYFVAVEGFDDVYIIPRGIAGQFLLPKTQIISQLVTPPLELSSPLSAIRDITFAGGGLKQPVAIYATAGASGEVALAALSFGASTHILRSAATYQLDQAYGIQILGSLFEISAIDVVGYGLSDEEIAALGFDQPYMAIEYDMINGVGVEERRMSLRFARAEDGFFYATLDDSGVVYLIDRKPFLDIQYDRLLLRWFLTPLLMDLSSVTVVLPDESRRFDIDASDPRNPTVYYNGDALDISLFHAFFRLITSAAHDGNYLGSLNPPQDEQPALTILYEYVNPEKQPDVMTFFPGGVRRANVFINDVGEFAMRDIFVQRVREGTENLIAGSPIEENW